MGDIVFFRKDGGDGGFVIHIPSWEDFTGLFRKKKAPQMRFTLKKSDSYFDRPPPQRYSDSSSDRETFYAITPR